MTLADLRASLLRNAAEFRSHGINCCAQLAENTAVRLTEAMEDEE
jgi:hypothetical protein